MKKEVKLIDWMICDDIRTEDTGKHILIGIYEDNIVVNTLPVILPQIYIYTKWNTEETNIKNFEIKINQPNGKTIGPLIGEFDFPIKKKATINWGISPFNIESTGTYIIDAVINEKKVHVGSFNVILKKS